MGKQPVNWTQELLMIKNRTLAGTTAPADGLYLGAVYYPEHFGLKKHPMFNKLPADAKRFD
jgi:tRNA pseudouridine38-40 synthase